MTALMSAHALHILLGFAAAALLAAFATPQGQLSRSYLLAMSTLFLVLALISLINPQCPPLFFFLAVLPAALIGQHALYLGQMKNPFRSQGRMLEAIDQDFLPNDFTNGLTQARKTSERDFGWATLSFRFGVPAVVIALFIGLFGSLLYEQKSVWLWSPDFLTGARYGGAGAYIYVLLYLSRRNFRHDVTSGAAVWAAVDIVLGPILGGVTALLWSKAQPSPAQTATFTSAVVFFAAGLAPRHMASVLEEAAKRLMRSPDDKSQLPPPRTKALTLLRGISPAMAERLEEDGIEDLHGMAMADPLRLMRNTSFDQRQIVTWIDEAILIASLPDKWEKLEAQGITGAMDLAWYYDQTTGADKASASPTPPTQSFLKLAEKVDVDATILWALAERFYWDGQVQLVWVLYQIGAEGVRNSDVTDEQAEAAESRLVKAVPGPGGG